MMLRRDNRIEKGKARKNAAEEENKGKIKEFCTKFWESTKQATQILAIATGMVVMAYGCGSRPHNVGDADADSIEVVDGETDGEDVPDVIGDEVETNCLEESEVLEGIVDGILANTATGEAILDGSDSEVSGDYEASVGGDVSGDLLMLGDCTADSGSSAALGVSGGSVGITPEYRLDLGVTAFTAEMPSVGANLCPPPEVDDVPVSMYLDETNLAVKEAVAGTVDTRGEFGFVTPLIPLILVNDSETASPVALDGSGYAVKAVMVSLQTPLLEMAAALHSDTGENVLEREVNGSIETVNSRTLRIYQLGSGDSILPGVNWNAPVSVTLCLRSESGDPKELDIEIDGDIIAAVADACGKIFAGFDIESLTADISVFNPPHLRSNYSVVSSSGTGLNAMEEGTAGITVTFRREVVVADTIGENVVMEVNISGELVSKDVDSAGAPLERISFSIPTINVIDPDASVYLTTCGYEPGGIF